MPGPADASNVAEALVSSETAQEAKAIANDLRGFRATRESGWRSDVEYRPWGAEEGQRAVLSRRSG